MSDELTNAKCDGDCSTCGSDCETRDLGSGATITLQMDNGENVNCAVLTAFEIEDKNYIVLLPLGDDGMASGDEVFIYRYSVTAEGAPMLENIADDDEYSKVAEAFEEYLAQVQEEAELDELASTIGTEEN